MPVFQHNLFAGISPSTGSSVLPLHQSSPSPSRPGASDWGSYVGMPIVLPVVLLRLSFSLFWSRLGIGFSELYVSSVAFALYQFLFLFGCLGDRNVRCPDTHDGYALQKRASRQTVLLFLRTTSWTGFVGALRRKVMETAVLPVIFVPFSCTCLVVASFPPVSSETGWDRFSIKGLQRLSAETKRCRNTRRPRSLPVHAAISPAAVLNGASDWLNGDRGAPIFLVDEELSAP